MAAAFDIWPSFCNLKQQKNKFVTSYLYKTLVLTWKNQIKTISERVIVV
jgi:hypothetical protein